MNFEFRIDVTTDPEFLFDTRFQHESKPQSNYIYVIWLDLAFLFEIDSETTSMSTCTTLTLSYEPSEGSAETAANLFQLKILAIGSKHLTWAWLVVSAEAEKAWSYVQIANVFASSSLTQNLFLMGI